MSRRTVVFTTILLATATTHAAATVSFGEIALEAGAGMRLERRGPDRGVFPVQILYGAAPNLQIGIGSTLFTDPRSVTGPEKSGDLAATLVT